MSAGLSTRSLQLICNCLERAIRHAEIRDLIGRNVAALVKAPQWRPGRALEEPDPRAGRALLAAAEPVTGV
jgi:hypothetical protein